MKDSEKINQLINEFGQLIASKCKYDDLKFQMWLKNANSFIAQKFGQDIENTQLIRNIKEMYQDKMEITQENALSLYIKMLATYESDRNYMKNNDMSKLEDTIRKTLFKHSPIVYLPGCQKESQKESLGTSIYITFNNQKYILTVGHIFSGGRPATHDKPLQMDLSKIYIGNGVPLSDLKRGVIYPPAEEDNHQEMDYALFLVNDKIAQKLEDIYSPYPILPSKSNYYPTYGFLFGYPCRKNKSNPYSKHNVQVDNDLCLRGFIHINTITNPRNNLFLFCDQENVSTIDEMVRNQSHTVCKLNGMSGCGIWDFPYYPIMPIQTTIKYRLCAIFTSFSKRDKMLIGLHFNDIVDFLEQASTEIAQMPCDQINRHYRM